VHAQLVAERGAVAAEAPECRLAFLQQPARLACDVAIEEFGASEPSLHGAVDHGQPGSSVLAVKQRGDCRRRPGPMYGQCGALDFADATSRTPTKMCTMPPHISSTVPASSPEMP